MFGLEKLSNLTQRIIAGIIGATLLIVAVIFSQWSFLAVFTLIMFLSLAEFYKLVGGAGLKPFQILGFIFSAFLWFFVFQNLFFKENFFKLIFLVIPALITFPFLFKLYQKNDAQPFESIAITFLGVIYVALPWVLFMQAGFFLKEYSYKLPLGILFCLWASDTGAYFVGRKFGKHKLFERISPKKTWEGLVGGFLLSQVVSFFLAFYFTEIEVWRWWLISVLIVVFGTWGDLVESMLKRSLQIKDSGSVIPGHGGFLDRFDGLLIAMPWVAVILYL
ncbi:MAG: phosphatidate cytidylyltransferase [Raineya sp.]|nr:phosphatidate cytidylyltransferase [Raineya sp.]